MTEPTAVYEQVVQLEEDIDREILRNGKSETYWEWVNRLDKLYDKLDELEARDYGEDR